MREKIDLFINNVLEEKEFRFGEPWRYRKNSIGILVPILRRVCRERRYITLEEAIKKGITFEDSGSIGKVVVKSNLDSPVFIRIGTALKGIGTQSRTMEMSVIVAPNVEEEIPVKCVYATHPIRERRSLEYAGHTPMMIQELAMGKCNFKQHLIWTLVSRYCGKIAERRDGSNLERDDLIGAMEEVEKFKRVLEILKELPCFENQVGAVIYDLKSVVGIELFDHPKSWEAIHREVLKKFCDVIVKKQGKPLFKRDHTRINPLIKEFLRGLREGDKKEVYSRYGAKTYSIDGKDILGEVTEMGNEVIHFIGMKKGEWM
jgi:hypothetical protein